MSETSYKYILTVTYKDSPSAEYEVEFRSIDRAKAYIDRNSLFEHTWQLTTLDGELVEDNS